MGQTSGLLSEASGRLRPHDAADLSRSDLSGQDLRSGTFRGTALRDADLRGTLLLAADLSGVDLGPADLLADLRDAKVHKANLGDVLFLTQSQVNAMRGDAGTTLPDGIERPAHWLPARQL